MIETSDDQFRSRKGGFVTMDFELPAERSFLARLVANALQDHAQSGSSPNFVHTSTAAHDAVLARPDFDASSSNGVPSLFDIALYGPASGEDKLITNAVLQSFTMNFDMSDGRLLLSGTFYSGFAANGFKVGQTLSANSGEPTLISTSPTQIESYFDTKTLDINGSGADMVMTGVSFTIENNVARVGRAADGDCENYAWGIPSVNITGEISFLYDDNFKDGANNVLQDFLDGDTATLTLKQSSDGTVSTAGEMSIIAEIYSTAVNYDLNADSGAVITIPFKVVQPMVNGAANGKAFEFIFADGIDNSSW
jgi:hypothetical protein